MKELSIGQMARLNGLSEQALRLYDKAGLFSPMYRDAENGYRYYDIRQSAQLDMIQHMKALGMSLKDIREQLTHFELDMFKTILHRNLEELELRSRELMYQRRAIERTLESYEWYENAPPDGTIVLEYIPGRLTYMTDSGVNFYDYDIDVYEKILRDLKENLIANQLSPIYFYNAGTVMRREYLMEGKYQKEQLEIEARVKEVTETLNDSYEKSQGVRDFLSLIRNYQGIKELDATIINALIDKILVSEREKLTDGTVRQEIKIYYKFIGFVGELHITPTKRWTALKPKNCTVCGVEYVPRSAISKYCPECRKRIRKVQGTETKRRSRERNRQACIELSAKNDRLTLPSARAVSSARVTRILLSMCTAM